MSVMKYSSQFHLMMAARNRKAFVVNYKGDGSDAGLYLGGLRNSFGTALAARGPRVELERLLAELRS